MIDVTVKIPEERVGDFYELVGRWLSEEPVADEVTDTSTGPKGWTNSNDDLVLARSVWEKFSARAKAVFSLLMDQPRRQGVEQVPGFHAGHSQRHVRCCRGPGVARPALRGR